MEELLEVAYSSIHSAAYQTSSHQHQQQQYLFEKTWNNQDTLISHQHQVD